MLSDRLQKIYDMTPKVSVVADIGTDHGYLPIALVKSGKVNKAYAMDVNKGPLEKASINIAEHQTKEDVQVILSDGLEKLPSDVEVVVIAGMGGMLIARILEDEKDKLQNLDALILSPHLDDDAVRKKVHALGWSIEDESMVKDNDKYYTVMRCIPGDETYTELEYGFGKCLMASKEPVWLDYMQHRIRKTEQIIEGLSKQDTKNTRKRLEAIKASYEILKEVMVREG